MHFIGDFFLALMTGYLALTGAIADSVLQYTQSDTEHTAAFARLSSAYDALPAILIENAAYQNAAALDGTQISETVTDPLDALVNILCTYTSDNYTRTTTGTGYFVDSDGVILTNAHVAQFLLLETLEGNTDCVLRTGDPATAQYRAELLYISPAWIQKHAALIDAEAPRGTGERDYALLYVTAGLENKPMPGRFPALEVNTSLLPIQAIGWDVRAAGYPAEELFRSGDITDALVPKAAATRIVDLMTFGSNYADLMTIGGSEIGEQGSSGGPVVNAEGQAIGLISTKGDSEQYGEGALRAITLSYIDRTIKEETGFTLTQNLSGNLPYRAKLFKDTVAPFLKRMLERELAE